MSPGMSQTWEVGRSLKKHPERRLEMAEREAMADGNYHAAAQLAGQRVGLNQYNAANQAAAEHQQWKDQYGVQQNQQERMDRYQMWQAEQEARQRQGEEHWQHQQTMWGLNQGADAMERERQRQQLEQDRNRVPTVGTIPVPGTDYVIPHADGRPMGTLPQHQDKPQGPTPEEISKHIADMKAQGVKAEYGKSGWTYKQHAQKAETVKVYDELNKKVVDWPAGYEVPKGMKELNKKGAVAAPQPAKPAGQGGWKGLLQGI
jgi:hypothetical protein